MAYTRIEKGKVAHNQAVPELIMHERMVSTS